MHTLTIKYRLLKQAPLGLVKFKITPCNILGKTCLLLNGTLIKLKRMFYIDMTDSS
jgi:hypothetical protein